MAGTSRAIRLPSMDKRAPASESHSQKRGAARAAASVGMCSANLPCMPSSVTGLTEPDLAGPAPGCRIDGTTDYLRTKPVLIYLTQLSTRKQPLLAFVAFT